MHKKILPQRSVLAQSTFDYSRPIFSSSDLSSKHFKLQTKFLFETKLRRKTASINETKERCQIDQLVLNLMSCISSNFSNRDVWLSLKLSCSILWPSLLLDLQLAPWRRERQQQQQPSSSFEFRNGSSLTTGGAAWRWSKLPLSSSANCAAATVLSGGASLLQFTPQPLTFVNCVLKNEQDTITAAAVVVAG